MMVSIPKIKAMSILSVVITPLPFLVILSVAFKAQLCIFLRYFWGKKYVAYISITKTISIFNKANFALSKFSAIWFINLGIKPW